MVGQRGQWRIRRVSFEFVPVFMEMAHIAADSFNQFKAQGSVDNVVWSGLVRVSRRYPSSFFLISTGGSFLLDRDSWSTYHDLVGCLGVAASESISRLRTRLAEDQRQE